MLIKLLMILIVVTTPTDNLPNVRGTNQEYYYADLADQTIRILEEEVGRPLTYPELWGMLWHHEVGTLYEAHPFVLGVEEAIAHQYSAYCQQTFPCDYRRLVTMLGLGFDAFWMNGRGSINNMLEIFGNEYIYQRSVNAGLRIMVRSFLPFDGTDAWSAGPLIHRTHIRQGDRDERGWYAAYVGVPPGNSFPGYNFVVWNSSGVRFLD